MGQHNRQLLLRYRNGTAMIAIDNGNRCAPEPLTGNQPVAQAEVDLHLSHTLFSQVVNDGFFGVFVLHAVKLPGVDHDAIFFGGLCHILYAQLFPFGHNHDGDGQIIFFGKQEVPFVMSRHAHDSTGAVFVNNIVPH